MTFGRHEGECLGRGMDGRGPIAAIIGIMCGKRPTQPSDKRIWCGFGVQMQAFSLDSPLGVEIRQSFGKMVASEAANGQCRLGPIGEMK